MDAKVLTHHQKGFVLPLVLILVLVVGVLAIGALQDSAQQERQSGVFARQTQMFEWAESQLMLIEESLLQASLDWVDLPGYQGSCDPVQATASPPSDFRGLAIFSYTQECQQLVWSSWLEQHCPTDASLDALQLAAIPEGWSTCATIWQAAQVGLDTSGTLKAHGGSFGETLPVWRYLVTLQLQAPESQGGGRIVLQSLVNAEEKSGGAP